MLCYGLIKPPSASIPSPLHVKPKIALCMVNEKCHAHSSFIIVRTILPSFYF